MNQQKVTTKTEERLILIRRILEQSGTELTKEKTKVLKKIEEKIKELSDEQFAELIKEINPSPSIFFYGQYYSLTDGVLNFTDSSELIRRRVREALKRWQDRAYYILFAASKIKGAFTERQLAEKMKKLDFPYLQHSLLGWFESFRLLMKTPEGKWKVPEEILSAMKKELADYQPKLKLRSALAKRELEEVMRMEKEFDDFLKLLMEERLDRTISFGEEFSVSKLVEYLRSLFGPVLYYDILLTMTQQYSLADVSVVTEEGGARMRTGFNLALFGEPGTGKTFSTYTMIMGDPNKGIPAHGLPGRNRYCGGMTPAKFIRIGEAYEGRKYNFIITEFNDWFKYCLPYDALVLTATGELVPIGEIVERKKDISVVSVNPRTLELEIDRVQKVSSRETDELVELTTETGKLLRLTPNHPLPVLTTEGITWKLASEFEISDYLISLGELPSLLTESQESPTFWQFLPENVYVKINPQTLSLFRKLINDKFKNLKEFSRKIGVKYTTFHAYLTGRSSIPFMTFRKMLQLLDLKIPVYELIEKVSRGVGSIKLPNEIPAKFMYFVGAVIGDGNINQNRRIKIYCPSDPEIVERCLIIIRDLFGVGYIDKNGMLIVNNAVLVGVIEKFGIPAKNKAATVDIPPEILRMPKRHISEYLRGLFDTDGTVGIKKPYGGCISFSTISPELARKVQLLLLRLGITSRVYFSKKNKSYCVEIADRTSVQKFAENIGFYSKRKKAKLVRLISRYRGNARTKTFVVPAKIASPLIVAVRESKGINASVMHRFFSKSSRYAWEHGLASITKKNLRKYIQVMEKLSEEDSTPLTIARGLANSPLLFERIVNKRILRGKFVVYDILVPKNHNFIANGFLVHNSGMVEPLKIAMEHGIIKWETARQTIGPYRFTSFLSVNYNTRVFERGYEVTIKDPNFSAIEERMLCRLHRLTKERYREIAEKQMELVLGKLKMEKASEIRDHLTLVHAIETEHPLVKDRFKYKPVLLTERVFEEITRAREAILDIIAQERLDFSPRLERRAIQLMCAMSLMSYFKEQDERIRVDSEAMKLGVRFYVEEAAVRSKEKFNPEDVLTKLGLS